MIKTILADDHRVFCDGMEKLLMESKQFEVIGKFHSSQEVLDKVYDLPFDLLILDFQMPGLNCEDVIQRIRIAKSSQKIIVLSMHEESIYSKKVLLAGANLYLTKSLSSEFLIESIIHEMNNSGVVIKSPVIKSKSLLSKQELTIIKLIADGNSSKEIGDLLKVSPLTIKAHRRNMMRKLDANNSSELVKIAIAKGIL